MGVVVIAAQWSSSPPRANASPNHINIPSTQSPKSISNVQLRKYPIVGVLKDLNKYSESISSKEPTFFSGDFAIGDEKEAVIQTLASLDWQILLAMSITPSDVESIKGAHQFVWDSETRDDKNHWSVRLAREYYDNLYKELALVDLESINIDGSIGLRWRTKDEVVNGKGSVICGSLSCTSQAVNTLEVPFRYEEHGVEKTELVKVKLCSPCAKMILLSNLRPT